MSFAEIAALFNQRLDAIRTGLIPAGIGSMAAVVEDDGVYLVVRDDLGFSRFGEAKVVAKGHWPETTAMQVKLADLRIDQYCYAILGI